MSDDERRWAAVEEATELLMEGEHARALEELRGVLERDPNNAYAYHYLGVAFYELGKLDAARDAYRAAVTLAPNYLAARVALSNTLRQLSEHGEALSEAIEALGRFPDDGDALHAAGLAHAARGDKRKAIQYLERFLATEPELEAALEVRGLIDLLAKQPGPMPV
jgi:tetratricopeptide (TPR) repeat protein